MVKEVVLDTETPGLDIKDGHRIVEIGCLELDNFVITSKRFHCFINPERKVSEQAFKVHGYSDEFLSKQKKFSDVAEEFLKFIENKKLVIHNASFDLSHLNNELVLLGKKKINQDVVVDTLEMARKKFPGSQNSLDALCKRFKINNSKREKHSALVDCELLSKVYVNLAGQKEPLFDFKNDDLKNLNFSKKEISYYKKIVKPTEDELRLHKDFLKKEIKKNFF